MELEPGYKHAEVGVIPEEWSRTTIRGIASNARNAIVGGPFGSDLVSSDYVEQGVPVIRGQNMSGQWVSGNFAFVTPAKAKSLQANLAHPGDIVFTQRGTLGQVSLVPERPFESYLVSQSQMKLSLNREAADPLFFFYVFTSEEQQKLIRGGTIQTGVPHVNLGILRDIPVQLPPLHEQRVIARALRDIDALLDALTQFITKKRDLKQTAMQQLLSGKRRLPGFTGQWRNCLLSDVATPSKGKGIRKDEVVADGLPCVRYGEIYTRHQDYIRGFYSFIPADVAKKSELLRRGDLLFAGSGETAEEIGKCVAFLSDEEAYAGSDIVIFRPISENPMYLGYLMNETAIASQKARLGHGDAVVHISARNLGRLEVRLPSIDEQTAIAAVLSDMDAEIAALEQRRDKTRKLKQSMMQELLTGRIRLV